MPHREADRTARRVLIVSTVELAESAVRRLVDDGVETMVVVPTVRQSRLQWLANDDDRARETAGRAAERLADATPGDTVAARAGDPDPIQAIEDALREFDADEIVIVTPPHDQAGWLEERAEDVGRAVNGIPIRRADVDALW